VQRSIEPATRSTIRNRTFRSFAELIRARGITLRNPFLPHLRRSKSAQLGDDRWARSVQSGKRMLETIIVLLILLWAFGFWGPYHAHLGNFVHVLIVVAVVVLIIRLIQGRRIL